MQNYIEVTNQKELDELIYSFGDFHDSMARELHIINRGGVLEDHKMLMSHQFDAQVLIQSQWPPYAVELLFVDVLEMSLNDAGDYFNATGKVKQASAAVDTIIIEMDFDSVFKISARRLFFQMRPDYLGMRSRLNSEIPSPKAKPARLLEGRWRQCSNCNETWEDDPNQVYSVCHKCLSLTELK